MTSDTRPPDVLQDTVRTDVREVSGVWWWYLILGVLWIWFGMYVLSYRVGSLAAVAAFVGVASCWAALPSWRWPAGCSSGAGCTSWGGSWGSPLGS
jgi:hypothetical protein